jgi:hypothetical protein
MLHPTACEYANEGIRTPYTPSDAGSTPTCWTRCSQLRWGGTARTQSPPATSGRRSLHAPLLYRGRSCRGSGPRPFRREQAPPWCPAAPHSVQHQLRLFALSLQAPFQRCLVSTTYLSATDASPRPITRRQLAGKRGSAASARHGASSAVARHGKTRQTETAQPGSPFAPPATMATSWAAGIIVSEVDPSYAAKYKCQCTQHTLRVHHRGAQ